MWAYKKDECPNCEGHALVTVGEWQVMGDEANRVYLCKECGATFTMPFKLLFNEDKCHGQWE